jgi:hypothetical protein
MAEKSDEFCNVNFDGYWNLRGGAETPECWLIEGTSAYYICEDGRRIPFNLAAITELIFSRQLVRSRWLPPAARRQRSKRPRSRALPVC